MAMNYAQDEVVNFPLQACKQYYSFK